MFGIKPKNNNHARSKRRGFTLSEVVVASALLIAAMVPILKGLTGAHLATAIIERRSRCLFLAKGQLDEISVKSIYNYSSSFAQSNNEIETDYLCNIKDSSISSNLRTVSVQVGYDTDGDGTLDSDETSVTLETYLAKRY